MCRLMVISGKNQRGARIAQSTHVGYIVHVKNRQIGGPSGLNLSDFTKAQKLCSVFGAHAPGFGRSECISPFGNALKQQRLTNFSQHVRCIVGRRTIDSESHIDITVQHFTDAANTRPQSHVGARAMSNMRAAGRQQIEFVVFKENSMGKPHV